MNTNDVELDKADDVVESVCHDIAMVLNRVGSQKDLDRVCLCFIDMFSVLRNRLGEMNVRVEYLSMMKAMRNGSGLGFVVGPCGRLGVEDEKDIKSTKQSEFDG